MKKPTSILLGLGAFALLCLIIISLIYIVRSPGGQQDTLTETEIADFYNGKTIRILVPSQPGGGFDSYARLLAPYLEKYTGATVRILNLPGAGGMRSTNELYNSPIDGLSMAIIGGSSMLLNKLAGIKGAEYDVFAFEYLGRIVADSRTLFVSEESGYDNFIDILNTDHPARFGATGLGGNGYIDGVISNKAFGLKAEIIHGFDTLAGVTQSVRRGNLHGAWGPWGSVKAIINAGTEKVILQSGQQRNPDIPSVPTVFEFIEQTNQPEITRNLLFAWDAFNEVGRFAAAPPGTPQGKVRFLRDAFRRALHDEDFIQSTKRSDLPVLYASPEDTVNIINQAMNMDVEMEQLFIQAVRGEL